MKDIILLPSDTKEEIAKKAVLVRPTARQVVWQELEFIAFIHFGMNTFSDREWGDGTESPSLFNPTEFDADQMVLAIKNAHMKALILTCKHHDGFCLWPSKYTEHSVKNSPWKDGKGDVVREISDSCKRHGIKFGVYLSPWDRHDERYGDSPRYNEYYLNQLTELLTEYGEVFDLWLDGACAEGPNGKKQEYDWLAINKKVRELQPNATITGVAPDARWCGNEAGVSRNSEWSVVPISNTDGLSADVSEKTAYAITRHNVGDKALCCNEDLGSIDKLKEHAQNSDRLYWYPAQVDVSIRPGWFYHEYEDNAVRTLERMTDIYLSAVGGNSQLLVNLPPDKRGRFHENDVARLQEIGDFIEETFKTNLIKEVKEQSKYEYIISVGKNTGNLLMLCEDITKGQRVESFEVFTIDSDGKSEKVYEGTTIGYKKLVRLNKQEYSDVKIVITSSRDVPVINNFGMFLMPPLSKGADITLDKDGNISLTADNATIYYTTDHTIPTINSSIYSKDSVIRLPLGGVVTATAVYDSKFDEGVVSHKEFGICATEFEVINYDKADIEKYNLAQIFSSDVNRYAKFKDMSEQDKPIIDIDMKKEYNLTGLHYMPVDSGYDANLNVVKYSLYTSTDGENYTPVVINQELSNIYHNPILHKLEFTHSVSARYIRFEVVESLNSKQVVVGEISPMSMVK